MDSNRYIQPGRHREFHCPQCWHLPTRCNVFCSKITHRCSLHKDVTFSQLQQYVVSKKGKEHRYYHALYCSVMYSTINAHKTVRQSSSSVYSNNMSENGPEVEEIVCKYLQVLRELRDPIPVPQGPVRKGGSVWSRWSEKATPRMWHLSEHSSREPSTVTNVLRTSRYS